MSKHSAADNDYGTCHRASLMCLMIFVQSLSKAQWTNYMNKSNATLYEIWNTQDECDAVHLFFSTSFNTVSVDKCINRMSKCPSLALNTKRQFWTMAFSFLNVGGQFVLQGFLSRIMLMCMMLYINASRQKSLTFHLGTRQDDKCAWKAFILDHFNVIGVKEMLQKRSRFSNQRVDGK